MDPALEIRKLPPSIRRELAQILDYDDSWKRLMAIIPKKLSTNNYVCDIKPDNLQKYNSDFQIIEQGKVNFKRSCTEILIDEWGTSGRPRATLGHLKYLLTKAELFRAADYVATLLNEELPPRPAFGPAAIVNLSLTENIKSSDPDPNLAEIEKHLDEINYPNIIAKIKKTSEEIKYPGNVIPDIVVSDVDNASNKSSNLLPLVIQKEKSKTLSEVSDMIQFSKSENIDQPLSSEIVPELSVLLQQSSVEHVQKTTSLIDQNSSNPEFTPAFSQILSSQVQCDQDIPSFSQLLNEKRENNCDISAENDFISDLSALNQKSLDKSDSDIIPNFDILQSKSSQNLNVPFFVNTLDSDSTSSSGPTKCPSPLPNLSLNTEPPHFTCRH